MRCHPQTRDCRRPCARPPAAVLLAAVLLLASVRPGVGADPELAGGASLLLPGVGQAANGDPAAGAVHLTLYLTLLNQYRQRIKDADYLEPEEREDLNTNTIRTNRTTADADLFGRAALNLSFYSAFGAYRDARGLPANEDGYTTPAPRESLADLALAPFDWELLRRPTTIGPLLLPLFVLLSPPGDEVLVVQPDDSISRRELAWRAVGSMEMVAVGEEAFFRGFLNNALSDWLGEPWGLAASSTVFGLGHQGTAGQATALAAATFGLYLGWLQQRNDYRIAQGVAIHYWWNVLASLALLREREPDEAVQVLNLSLRF